MKIKENKKVLIIGIIMLVLILSTGTLAYFFWEVDEENKTEFTLEVQGATLTISGGNVTHTGMYPTALCDGEAALIGDVATVTAVNATSSDMDVILRIRASLSGRQGTLTAENKGKINWAIVDTSAGTTCATTPYKGTMASVVSGSYTDIDTGIKFIAPKNGTTTKNFRIYVWLDSSYVYFNEGDAVTDPTQNMNISVKWSQASELIQKANPNVPVLDDGMIPVTISEDGVVTTVSVDDSTWYNYSNKEWANAVLVKSSGTKTRDYYKSNMGITIVEDDILAYYVWIPRYKYKIWTLTESSTGQEQTIEIEFEGVDASVTQGSSIGDYITHPAFIWDGNPIAGLWVGKFETTGSATTPTILPNTTSLRNQNVSTQFATSLKFAGGTLSNGTVTFAGNNTYGLISTTDSHMMKNSEWGAVAYLSHSVYGINSNIEMNSDPTPTNTTGMGACKKWGSDGVLGLDDMEYQFLFPKYDFNTGEELDVIPVEDDSVCGYGELSNYPQSTTGNITGVFDMSGGVYEYVMGYYSGANSNYSTDTTYFGWTSSNNYAGFTTQLSSKYWDNYVSDSTLTACNGGVCFGHSLSETSYWYTDNYVFIGTDLPWLSRGSYNYIGAVTSIFDYWGKFGIAESDLGFRSVLIIGL